MSLQVLRDCKNTHYLHGLDNTWTTKDPEKTICAQLLSRPFRIEELPGRREQLDSSFGKEDSPTHPSSEVMREAPGADSSFPLRHRYCCIWVFNTQCFVFSNIDSHHPCLSFACIVFFPCIKELCCSPRSFCVWTEDHHLNLR